MKSQKGFTLLEILLVLGLFAFIVIGIFTYYLKMSFREDVKNQIVYLNIIDNSLSTAFQTTVNFNSLDNTLAINNNLVPKEIIVGANIVNVFGGNINLSGTTLAGKPAYVIGLTLLDTKACEAIANSDFSNKTAQTLINGNPVKAINTQNTSVSVATVVSDCATSNINTVEFKNYITFGFTGENYTQKRTSQTDKYYIPTVASNVTSISPSCSGGSSFDGSFCSCPAGTSWDGFACTSVSDISNCQFGEGVDINTRTCQALKPTNSTSVVLDTNISSPTYKQKIITNNTHLTTPTYNTSATCIAGGGYWDSVLSVCSGIIPTQTAGVIASSPTPVYQGDRYLEQSYNAKINIPQNTALAQCTNSGGHWDGKVCNYCVDATAITIANSNLDKALGISVSNNLSTQTAKLPHTSTSSWDQDRCVTPPSSNTSYPQTINW
jgi:prepilin-type N-terminal cleavage/methylation domain-containing protein